MPGPILQCAANYSEGRRPEVMGAIVDAIAATPGACLADWSSDPDHNRMVATVLGPPQPVIEAVSRSAVVAVDLIDLASHAGVHPRIGAVDVVPFTPLRGLTMAECASHSHLLGARIAAECHVPVFMYESSAGPNHASALPALRRGGFESISMLDHIPSDYGPSRAHPTAGVTVIGARPALVAWNVMLHEEGHSAASEVAAMIRRRREAEPYLAGVRALGLRLERAGLSQVSMNLTKPFDTPLLPIVQLIQREAGELGAAAAFSELIGLVPAASIEGATAETLLWPGFGPDRTVEYWLERL